MGLSGCMSCLKYLLFAFNFIFWLAGISILALAIYLRVDGTTQNILGQDPDKLELFNGVCYVLMAAGGAIMIVGFCGCCGAAQESRMLLTLFAVALFLLLGSEIGAGAYTAFHKEQVTKAIDQAMLDLWKSAASSEASNAPIKEIQNDLQCCGYNNAGDYCNLNEVAMDNVFDFDIVVEQARCAVGGTGFGLLEKCPTILSATVGCRAEIINVLEKNINAVIAVAITIGVIELLGLIFSIMLCQAIGQDYTSGKLA